MRTELDSERGAAKDHELCGEQTPLTARKDWHRTPQRAGRYAGKGLEEVMNAVMKVDDAPQTGMVAANEGATILAVIGRAAADPNCDIDKMERLMQMHERMQAKQAEVAFSADLSAMQTELPSIGERGQAKVNGAVRYTFALWEDMNAAIKPVLSRFGFALSFRTDFSAGIEVTAVLSHKSGHSERTTIKLPADHSGSKNDVQAVASSVSYGKRYTAGALLNLTSHGEDDDAFRAGGGEQPETPAPTKGEQDPAKIAARKAVHDAALAKHSESVTFIKERIAADDMAAVATEWGAIPQEDQMALWLATTKGGVFTTEERKAIKERMPTNKTEPQE